ncbi:MAG: zinc-binding dehydrogenase, partial [Cyclobacteriaceae bacterium]|nr:zinc-binding dehydrogenase [Cyclobacteriaceae bacterium HetDA_MAG_MS6]
AQRKIKPQVQQVFALESAETALQQMESRTVIGKMVLEVIDQ